MTPGADYLGILVRDFVAGRQEAPDPPPDVDWHRFVELAGLHGLVPNVASLALPSSVPETTRDQFRHVLKQYRRQNSVRWIETCSVVESLREAGIESMLLKGPALGRTVYPDPALRHVADCDVLVRKSEVEPALETLKKRGYDLALTARDPSFYLNHHFHFVLSGPGGLVVELHWDLSRATDYFRFDLDGVFERSCWLEEPPVRVRIPSNGDQLLHAACQALRRGYADLRRTVDAALLIRHGAAGEEGLCARAHAQGMATSLWTLLEVTKELTGVGVPDEIERQLRPGVAVRTCLRSLDLPRRTVSFEAGERSGLRNLVVWLSCPTAGRTLGAVRRFVAPGTAELLDAGHSPDSLPGLGERGLIVLRHCWSLLKILGFQGWCLARHGARL